MAEIASRSKRIVLSKDCNLLKRNKIIWGHLVRDENPDEQIVDVVRLFQLEKLIAPYRRCIKCNGLLMEVDKVKIDHLLEPLTRKYYSSFHQCDSCSQVYWQGSHRSGLDMGLKTVLKMCQTQTAIISQ